MAQKYFEENAAAAEILLTPDEVAELEAAVHLRGRSLFTWVG
jgi:hypothetical protein